MADAFEQLQRYMRRRKATEDAGLKEGEEQLGRTATLTGGRVRAVLSCVLSRLLPPPSG